MSYLRVQGVSKHFGGLKAVDEVDLDVEKGEIRAIIGPNGSGKTTLINVITGVYAADSGRVFFKGTDISRWRPYRICALGIARTFQTIRLFGGLTVLENVMVGRYCRTAAGFWEVVLRSRRAVSEESATREKGLALLEIVGLARVSSWKGRNLPYGQQRLLEIARALATDPELLILDEPAAGMNPTEKETLSATLLRINKDLGLTLLLIEHSMRVVMRLASRVAVMNFGKKIADGTPEEVQNEPAVVEAYLGKGM